MAIEKTTDNIKGAFGAALVEAGFETIKTIKQLDQILTKGTTFEDCMSEDTFKGEFIKSLQADIIYELRWYGWIKKAPKKPLVSPTYRQSINEYFQVFLKYVQALP